MTIFAERLRILRLTRNLKQSDVADIMGVSTRLASYYEAGRHFPKDIQAFINLSQYFNVSIDWMLGNDARAGTREVNASAPVIPERVRSFVVTLEGQEIVEAILEAGLTAADIKRAIDLV